MHASAASQPLFPHLTHTTDGTPLHARVLILDDGRTRLAIVSLTVICLRREDCDTVREAVATAAQVAPENITIACTHVHSGPGEVFSGEPAVRQPLIAQIADAAAAAAQQALPLQPARLGVATANLPGVSRVRRILRRDGTAITLRRAWPQYWNWATDPDTIGPEEPLDDLLTVVRVETLAGDPLAAIMHFTCHPIPDFFGYAAALAERHLPGLTCLILNGCQGTVDTPFEVPMRGRTQADQLPILGEILGHRTLELLARADAADVPLAMTTRDIFLPVHPLSRTDLWPRLHADGGFHTILQAIRLGDLAFVTIPGEPQLSFGTRLSEISPFPLTRAVGVANDEVGYMLWPESRARGGYEADPDYYAATADEALDILLNEAREALSTIFRAGLTHHGAEG